MRRISTVTIPLALMLWTTLAVHAQASGTALAAIFREKARLTQADLAALDRGEPVVKVLPSRTKSEIAVIGIARLDVEKTTGVTIRSFRDSLTQKKSNAMMGGAQFSAPPGIEDLRGLKLEKSDFATIENCLTGECYIRISPALIENLRSYQDRKGAEYQKLVESAYRQEILGLVTEYAARGIEAIRVYDNSKRRTSLVDQHGELIGGSPLLADLTPSLADYLKRFPGDDLAIYESAINWSKVSFGLKPIITVTHTITYDGSSDATARYFVATRQIYASRYIDSSLALAALIDVPENGISKRYIIFTDISRSGELEGLFSGFKRSVVGDEAVRKIKEMLATAVNRLETGTIENSRTGNSADPEKTFISRNYFIILILFSITVIAAVLLIFRRRPEKNLR